MIGYLSNVWASCSFLHYNAHSVNYSYNVYDEGGTR